MGEGPTYAFTLPAEFRKAYSELVYAYGARTASKYPSRTFTMILRALRKLAANGDRAYVMEIARESGVEPGGVSQVLERMCWQLGLLTYHGPETHTGINPYQRRSFYSLTERGQKLADLAGETHG